MRPMSGPPGVQLDQLVVRYPASAGARAAVDALSLTLGKGQIGVLIGPSGCGKTTVLRAVAGLEHLAGGRVAVGGHIMSDAASGFHLAPEARRVGMVFQDYALFPHLSVAVNVAFGLRRINRAEADAPCAQGRPDRAARARAHRLRRD